MNIVIAANIFPPEIGGPAQYAANIHREFKALGNKSTVVTYGILKKFPTGIRHILYFFRLLPHILGADLIISLDQFSVGFPAVCAARLLGKKVFIRIGGDFLWEFYVERTRDLVLLRNFYLDAIGKLNAKERLIFAVTSWTLRHADALVFTTVWQKDIFLEPYHLQSKKILVIENYYGKRQEEPSFSVSKKEFIGAVRDLKWKNKERLMKAFERVKNLIPLATLNLEPAPYAEFVKRMEEAYAVALVSLGDVSPNMILDALRLGKPFILTRETGLYEKLKDVGLFVNPESEEEIANAFMTMARPEMYQEYVRKVRAFSFTHSWKQICEEFLTIANRV